MRELKHRPHRLYRLGPFRRTPPGVRELKLLKLAQKILVLSRTPPGVRELKPRGRGEEVSFLGRTPPGVRELKRSIYARIHSRKLVAPLPGCVN